MRVALFITCFNDTLFPETGKATVRLLERLGVAVEFPLGQTCCGQMHVNTGYAREAASLAGRFADVFRGYDAVVAPSASCAGTVRHLHEGLTGRRPPPVFELSEFLVDVLGVVDVGAYFPHRVTYHPTCHSLRTLQLGDRPLRLLRAVRGLELVELSAATSCCGFGGTFSLKNADTSTAMLGDKVHNVLATGAEVCAAADNSCLVHIGGGLSRLRAGVRTLHLAEILAPTEAAGRRRRAEAGPRAAEGNAVSRTWLGTPRVVEKPSPLVPLRPFPDAAREALRDAQLRRNLAKATTTIRDKRAKVVGEMPDWEALRAAGERIKDRVLRHLDGYLEQLEESITAAGGQVHWARDGAEAVDVIARIVAGTGASEVVKVKSLATDEVGLNEGLAERGIAAWETDLAELIVQLGQDTPSHILVPAIHRNRAEIREIFLREMPDVDPDLDDAPRALAEAARRHLRRKFLSARVAISGANFAVAETGTLVVVESEGNGRMCLTLPRTLISLVGIEKLVPTWADLEVFLQLLPRSSTGERMNPYTSTWTGVTPGDGPQQVHVVLLDNGRTKALADPVGRQTLRCIRCSACLNVCPVYERTGGHAYGSVYPGPIGAILTPQLVGVKRAASLPYASSLCGACFEVCPVRIDIPNVLVHLRAAVVDAKREHGLPSAEQLAMRAMAWVFASEERLAAAQRAGALGSSLVAHDGRVGRLPGPLSGWTDARDAPAVPAESFRAWWQREREGR